MKLTIESTPELVLHQGAICRTWYSEQKGSNVLLLVAGVVLPDGFDDPIFEEQLLGPFAIEGTRAVPVHVAEHAAKLHARPFFETEDAPPAPPARLLELVRAICQLRGTGSESDRALGLVEICATLGEPWLRGAKA